MFLENFFIFKEWGGEGKYIFYSFQEEFKNIRYIFSLAKYAPICAY